MNDTVLVSIASAIALIVAAIIANYPAWKTSNKQVKRAEADAEKIEADAQKTRQEITKDILSMAKQAMAEQETRHEKEIKNLSDKYDEIISDNSNLANEIEGLRNENRDLHRENITNINYYKAELKHQQQLCEIKIKELHDHYRVEVELLQAQILELQKRVKTGPWKEQENV